MQRQIKNTQKELEDAKAAVDDEADERARAEKAKKVKKAQISIQRSDETFLCILFCFLCVCLLLDAA